MRRAVHALRSVTRGRRSPDEAAPESRRDAGTTLNEILISMLVLGVIMSALTAALSITFRSLPEAESRLDDARATRSIGMWLAQDTMSTPPFVGEQSQGGMIVRDDDPPNSNDCTGDGSNLLHLQWTQSSSADVTFVANYRYVDTGVDATIQRYACHSTGGAAFVNDGRSSVLTGLAPGLVPNVVLDLDSATGGVERVRFYLTGAEGESVRVDTRSRNPADFFADGSTP